MENIDNEVEYPNIYRTVIDFWGSTPLTLHFLAVMYLI